MLLVEELFSLPDTHKDAIDSTNESPLNAEAIGGAKLVNVPTYYKNKHAPHEILSTSCGAYIHYHII